MEYLIASIICVAAAAFEGVCAGRDPMAKLRRLRQPAWSPPNWLWVLIGIGWYTICFTALVRLLPYWPAHKSAVVLLVFLMLANGAVNILQFRMERLDLSFLFLFPYWLVLGAFLWTACPIDMVTCGLFALYAVYQLYAAAWGYSLWRLNGAKPATDMAGTDATR
jgi:tryptophan-rich sensory protein